MAGFIASLIKRQLQLLCRSGQLESLDKRGALDNTVGCYLRGSYWSAQIL